MKKYFSNKAMIIYLILFFIPFFWFSYGDLDLGGDSTRLYFYDPVSWLNNIAFYSVNALSGIGIDNPNFMMIPFLLFLSFLKSILLNNPYFLNCFFSGFLLSGSFLFTYLSIKELLKNKDKNSDLIEYSSVISGLFFVFSPIIIYEWQKASYYFNHILVYPLTFFLFLKYINTKKYKYIIISSLITFIFSVNFSFATSPWFFAFFPLIFLFIFLYSVIYKKLIVFLRGSALFAILFLAIQSFQFLPQINNILDFSTPNSKIIFSEEVMKDRGLGYFLSVQPYVRLIYNITNQPQYDISTAFNHSTKDIIFNYGIEYQYLFFIYALIIVLGLILIRKKGHTKERVVYIALMGIFLILVFFITANINNSLLQFYKSLFSIPGFAMFRSFYTKFNLVFLFFYALLIGISLYHLLYFMKNKLMQFIFLSFISILIIFNAWPLISGQIVNGILWQSKNVKITTKMHNDYTAFVDSVKNEKLDSKYLSLPLTNESYQILRGQNGGAYFGPSTIPILTGKPDFPGLESFSAGGNKNINEQILEYLNNKDYKALNYLFSFLNIKYIFYNSDDYIYDNFPNYPYSDYLKSLFKTQDDYKDFINKLGYVKFYQLGDFYLYSNDKYFLPKIHSAKNIFAFDEFENINYDILSSNSSSLQNVVLDRNKISKSVLDKASKNIINVFKPKVDLDKLTLSLENNNLNEKLKLINIGNSNPVSYRIITNDNELIFDKLSNRFLESESGTIDLDSIYKKTYKLFLPKYENYLIGNYYFNKNNKDQKQSREDDIIIDALDENSFTLYSDFISEDDNSIQNYSFENDGSWSHNDKCGGSDTDAEIKYSDDATEGQKSLLMVTKKGIACSAYYLNEINGDYIYKFAFDYKNIKGSNSKVVLSINDKISINELLNADDNDWHHFEKIVKLSEKSNKINIFIYNESSDGITTENLFDNFVFVKTIPQYKKILDIFISKDSTVLSNDIYSEDVNFNLSKETSDNSIQNYSFENDGSWSHNDKCGGSDTDAEIKYSDDATEGQKSLLMVTKKGIACSAYYLNEINGDYIYKFAFDYKNIKGSNSKVVLSINDKISINELLNADDNDWHHFEKIVKLSEKSNKINIFIYNESSDGITTENLFDNFVFVKTAFIPNNLYFISSNSEKIETPVLEFKKINPTKYRIRIHGAKGDFPLVFSESFHSGWKAYAVKNENFINSDSGAKAMSPNELLARFQNSDFYKILDGNEDDQASREEMEDYIDKGWVSDLGNGREKKIEHKKWEDGKEKLDYIEKYRIDFVSKNFQDTIQNDNLPGGRFWETWLANKVQSSKFKVQNFFELNNNVIQLSEENHLTANGYANSWWVETEKICNNINSASGGKSFCVQNADGSYDFEMVVEFWPQRLFYAGLAISGLTLFGCLAYLYWISRKKINGFIKSVFSSSGWKARLLRLISLSGSLLSFLLRMSSALLSSISGLFGKNKKKAERRKAKLKKLGRLKHKRKPRRINSIISYIKREAFSFRRSPEAETAAGQKIEVAAGQGAEHNRAGEFKTETVALRKKEYLEFEKKKLEMEKEKLAVEKDKLKLEKEKTAILEKRLPEKDISVNSLSNLSSSAVKTSFEESVVAGTGINDIDLEFVNSKKSKIEEELGKKFKTSKKLLEEIYCLNPKGAPTSAGILLFGKSPQKHFKNSYLTFTKYDMSGNIEKNINIKGSLINIIEKGFKTVKEHIPTREVINSFDANRQKIPVYPYVAIRELLINAIAHRDYEIGGSRIIISLYNDRMEFQSPGELPNGITPETVLRSQFNRNPVMAEALYYLGYIEQLGSGLDRTFQLFKDLQKKEPKVESFGNMVVVTIYK